MYEDAQEEEMIAEQEEEPIVPIPMIETAEMGVQAFASKVKPTFADQWTETM